MVAVPGGIRVLGPGPGRAFLAGPLGPAIGRTSVGGVDPLIALLLVVGIVGLGLILVLFWLPWFAARR